MPPPPRTFPSVVTVTSLQYGIPVIKYDRKGFKARQRQLLLTQKAAYVVELAKIKQKIEYSTLKGKMQAIVRQLTGPMSAWAPVMKPSIGGQRCRVPGKPRGVWGRPGARNLG